MKVEEGARLRLVRKAHNKTQKEAADLLNVGRTAYNNYENGVSKMPDVILDIFVREFDTTHEYIKGRSAQMSAKTASDFANMTIMDLIELLPESDLKNEIRLRAIKLIENDADLKQKIILLHELKDELQEEMIDQLKK